MYRDIIKVYDNTLPLEFCEELIEVFEGHPSKAQGISGNHKVNLNTKDSIDLHISSQPDLKDIDSKLNQYLSPYIRQYIENLEEQAMAKSKTFFPLELNELTDNGYNMKKYNVNTGKFTWHRDDKVTTTGLTRTVAIIWYLNDVQRGGYTEFFDGTKIHPVQGRMLMFPSTWTFPHQGVPPESNEKYIITSFLSYQAYQEY